MDFRFKYSRHPDSEQERLKKRNDARQEADRVKRMRGLAYGLSIPMTLAAGPVGGWLIGSWLDRSLGTGFWMIVLILVGTLAGLVSTIRMLSRLNS
ncbi:AtpZ/AtpI family protein [bacterium]|nr:AtpZ/AtpI family protein [bacterium]